MLGAKELYQAHLGPYLAKAQSSLNTKLDTVQEENGQISETIEQQRREIDQLLSRFEAVVADVEGAANATTEFDPEDDLRRDAQEIDEEIQTQRRP